MKNIRQSLFHILFGLFAVQTTVVADLGLAGPGCPAGGSDSSPIYLSDVIPGSCNDASQIQNIIFQLGQTGTLVIDKVCELNSGLRLPSRFTLKGTGIGSSGILAFNHDGIALSVCPEQPRGYVTIADLDLYGPYRTKEKNSAIHSKGIVLTNQNIIYLRNIRVSNFYIGLVGSNSYSVFVYGSNISNNKNDNIQIGYASNGWRIRDGLVSQAGRWGINVQGPGDAKPLIIGGGEEWNTSNDLLIDGVRMESNSKGGVRTNAYGTRIINTRLEFNGHGSRAPDFQGILVDSDAEKTRILSNLLSSNCIDDLGVDTEQAFNIDANACSDLAVLGFSP